MELQVLILILLSTLQVQESRTLDYGIGIANANSYEVNLTEATKGPNRVLSRRKRFLTFPDGSSLQLVFCCQTAALLSYGDIFLYSNTAALAWTLPEDPDFIRMFKSGSPYSKDAQRREDKKHIYYVGSKGEVLAKVPYRRKIIVNPAFAKRSIDPVKEFETVNRTEMHAKQEKREYLDLKKMEDSRIEFHRSGRVEVFQKLEVLFSALGQKNGKHCVLRQLCDAKKQGPQGTFLDEIRRAVFTFPKGKSYEDTRDYDEAHSTNEECAKLYPECSEIKIEN